MPEKQWPDAVRQAVGDSWMHTEVLDEEEIETFAEHWGGFGAGAFTQALLHGNAVERLFAIFALGYLASPEVEPLLLPFLTSPLRKERWASASSLGRCKNEQALLLLLEFLQEGLEYHSAVIWVNFISGPD